MTTGPQAPISPFVTPPTAPATDAPVVWLRSTTTGYGRGAGGDRHREAHQDAHADEGQEHGEVRSYRVAVDVGQDGGADERADGPRDRQLGDEAPVDVAQLPVRHAGHDASHDLGQVDGGRHGARADARAEQEARRRGAEAHAERAVDHRGKEAGQRHDNQVTHRPEILPEYRYSSQSDPADSRTDIAANGAKDDGDPAARQDRVGRPRNFGPRKPLGLVRPAQRYEARCPGESRRGRPGFVSARRRRSSGRRARGRWRAPTTVTSRLGGP